MSFGRRMNAYYQTEAAIRIMRRQSIELDAALANLLHRWPSIEQMVEEPEGHKAECVILSHVLNSIRMRYEGNLRMVRGALRFVASKGGLTREGLRGEKTAIASGAECLPFQPTIPGFAGPEETAHDAEPLGGAPTAGAGKVSVQDEPGRDVEDASPQGKVDERAHGAPRNGEPDQPKPATK